MTGPRTKRQFAGAASDPAQRQITSFFKTSSTVSRDGIPAPLKQAALSNQTLPPQVQTDLLNVGMRVRKAVPEGYKTGSEYSAFTLWAEDNNGRGTAASHQTSSAPSAAPYSSTMRELEPFCGINKVGGLAFQPAYDRDSDAMPGLTGSQDTISSTASSIPSASFFSPATIPLNLTTTHQNPSATASFTLPTRKRFFTSEEEDDANAASNPLQHSGPFRLSSDSQREASWLEDEISPRSLAPPPGLWERARVLAVPRRLRQGRKGGSGHGVEQEEQENMMVVVRGQGAVDDGNDFEDANFLDYGGLLGDGRMDVE